jgi:c(7)-type cytochrome triheme protein
VKRSWLGPVLVASLVALASTASAQQPSGKKRRPLPDEYGRVVLDNGSSKARLAPVVFEHWLHRSMFTCRLCHVDVGFAMKAGATSVRAADNAAGHYCGACHNRAFTFRGRQVFPACSKGPAREGCTRCHSAGTNAKPEHDFVDFAKGMPRGRFGNGIDWELAEESHLVQPVDFLEGVSIKRSPLTVQKDFALSPKVESMPEIIFSHKKHTVWSGCEACHPEIFFGVKRGATKYSMVEIFEGRFCGVCHGTVAFPTLDCQRCHTRKVQ